MFGLSLTEILFTAGLIFAVWRGFKVYERMKADPQARVKPGRGARMAGGRPPADKPAGEVELERCPDCGTYRPKGSPCDCDRVA